MTASGAQKPNAAADKLVLPVGKSVFTTGLPVTGGEIRPDVGGARQNRPVHRKKWRRVWRIQLPTFSGLKSARITGKPAGNTNLPVTVAGKPI
jgi:hypothetical protein